MELEFEVCLYSCTLIKEVSLKSKNLEIKKVKRFAKVVQNVFQIIEAK